MRITTLITPSQLAKHLGDPDWAIVDCRFSLADTEWGQRDYLQAHIPGAVYAHLNDDLSAEVIPGVTGRHPLPSVEAAAKTFGEWGIGAGVQVVTYDDAGGALAAVRLWWMLRWLGHTAAAVLDGGFQRWMSAGYPLKEGGERRPRRKFVPKPRPELVATTAEVNRMRELPDYLVVDARTAERYRGENETIDPVAGHIPGAVSAPYVDNLTPEGVFRSKEELRTCYRALFGNIPAERSAFYCGSGVTSIHDILAIVHAGMGEPRLYVGSWSEWITDRERPVAR